MQITWGLRKQGLGPFACHSRTSPNFQSENFFRRVVGWVKSHEFASPKCYNTVFVYTSTHQPATKKYLFITLCYLQNDYYREKNIYKRMDSILRGKHLKNWRCHRTVVNGEDKRMTKMKKENHKIKWGVSDTEIRKNNDAVKETKI